MADTGNGSTFAFGTSGFSAAIMSIKTGTIKRPRINTSHLGTTTTTGETYVPGDLCDHDELELEVQYDPNTQPPYNGAVEPVTLTFPIPSGLSNGATLTGNAFVTEFGGPTLKNNELMMATIKVSWTALPTFTDAT